MAVIDTLSIKISANANDAAKALNSLADAMKRVRAALMNTKDGVTVGDKLAKSIHELNNALTRINTNGIKKLNQLSGALMRFAAAAKQIKGVSISKNLARSVKNAQNALAVQQGTATSPGGTASTDIKKVGDETEKTGEKAKKAAGGFQKLWAAIKRIAFYRAIRAAMRAISEAFSEGLKNAYHYSKQSATFQRLADTLDRLKSSSSQMINQLGAFWGEFKQFIQPAILWIIEKVRKIAEWVTQLFAALNGEKTYLQAQYVAKEWDEATDSLKKYKQQLLGLDELNNLTSQKGSDKDETDYSKLYKEVAVGAGFLKVGAAWGALKQQVEGFFGGWENLLLVGIGGLVLGSVLLYTGHIGLGLGVILGSGFLLGKTIAENWQALGTAIQNALQQYTWVFALGGVGLTVLGAAFLFTGHIGLGLACILGGVTLAVGAIAENWQGLSRDLQNAMSKYGWLFALGGVGLTVLGAALLFTSHIGLGLGCILGGVTLAATAIAMNWQGLSRLIHEKLLNFFGPGGLIAFGAGMLAIGAILAFSSASIPVGIAMMLAGVAGLGFGLSQIEWDGLGTRIREKMLDFFGPGGLLGFGAGMVVIGALMAFSGVALPIGLTLMALGLGTMGIAISAIDWTSLGKQIREKLVTFFGPGGLIAFGAGMIAIGALLAFSSANIPLGIALMAAGGASLGVGLSAIDWGGILNDLKRAWDGIRNWWNGTVKPKIQAAVDWVKGLFGGIGDSIQEGVEKIKKQKNPEKTTVTTPITGVEIQLDPTVGILDALSDTRSPWEKITDLWDGIFKKAQGGIVKPSDGSLFYAGEAGPEFVGAMGNSSAIANTGQMTDAIYKAAYMGMSRALQENGGNGLSGFVPATTDDLFIAMRKKASNYNKATGSSAFA